MNKRMNVLSLTLHQPNQRRRPGRRMRVVCRASAKRAAQGGGANTRPRASLSGAQHLSTLAPSLPHHANHTYTMLRSHGLGVATSRSLCPAPPTQHRPSMCCALSRFASNALCRLPPVRAQGLQVPARNLSPMRCAFRAADTPEHALPPVLRRGTCGWRQSRWSEWHPRGGQTSCCFVRASSSARSPSASWSAQHTQRTEVRVGAPTAQQRRLPTDAAEQHPTRDPKTVIGLGSGGWSAAQRPGPSQGQSRPQGTLGPRGDACGLDPAGCIVPAAHQ